MAGHHSCAARRPAAGYAYLALLFAVVLIGAGLGGAAQIWHTQMQRERERQLLWVGNQYRQAIELYWRASGAGSAAGASANPPVAAGAGNPPLDATTLPPQPAGRAGTSVATTADGQAAGTAGVNGSTGSLGAPVAGGVPAGPSRYPPSLEALLVDPRFQQIRRYIRKLYPDPITGQADWVPILAPNGGIMGVRSASEAEPFKHAGFSPKDNDFTGKTHYSEWKFIFVPPQRTRARNPGITPSPVNNFGAAPGLAPSTAPQEPGRR